LNTLVGSLVGVHQLDPRGWVKKRRKTKEKKKTVQTSSSVLSESDVYRKVLEQGQEPTRKQAYVNIVVFVRVHASKEEEEEEEEEESCRRIRAFIEY
jgi:hypothetical protein